MEPDTTGDPAALRILLLENIHAVARHALEGQGHAVTALGTSLKEAELIDRINGEGISVLGIRSRTQVTARVFEACPGLVTLGAFCIGTNQIDLDAANAARRGGLQRALQQHPQRGRADHREIIMLSRQLGDRTREMHQGQWRKVAAGSNEVRGKTLGIVGYGHIGRQVGVLAEMMGMRVVFHDIVAARCRWATTARPTASTSCSLESDFVTLHVPETPLTHRMIGEAQLGRMKRGSAAHQRQPRHRGGHPRARGGVALGHLAGAAVDVFPSRSRRPTAATTSRASSAAAERLPDAPHRRLDERGAGEHRPRGGGARLRAT
jgi:D-3-phosphoglycerate dehydrogenase